MSTKESAEIKPFRISVGDDVLNDLKSRLRNTRWPEAEAAARHWPVESLPLHHLAMLTEPAKVAAAIERLVDRIA